MLKDLSVYVLVKHGEISYYVSSGIYMAQKI